MQLQDYALGQMEYKTNLGYVKRGCATSRFDTVFSAVGKGRTLIKAFYISTLIGIFCQIVFVWIVLAVFLKLSFKEYAQKTFTYSYDVYGMFWGISTTAVGFLGALYGVHATTVFEFTANKKLASGWPAVYVSSLIGALLFILVLELPVAIYTARKATVAVPCIFKYPATLLCCGRKRLAECFVTTVALWVDLAAMQLILFTGSVAVFAISAAPFAIASNVMVLVLAFSCFANIFSLLFTIFAHICTFSNQWMHSSSMVLRAAVLLPLLLMIISYAVVIATMGFVTNIDTKRNNIFLFINSIGTPILLGLVIIFLKRFISAWLKWSPQETEQRTDNSHRQEANEELLDP